MLIADEINHSGMAMVIFSGVVTTLPDAGHPTLRQIMSSRSLGQPVFLLEELNVAVSATPAVPQRSFVKRIMWPVQFRYSCTRTLINLKNPNTAMRSP